MIFHTFGDLNLIRIRLAKERDRKPWHGKQIYQKPWLLKALMGENARKPLDRQGVVQNRYPDIFLFLLSIQYQRGALNSIINSPDTPGIPSELRKEKR
jgi:hypothetical protein